MDYCGIKSNSGAVESVEPTEGLPESSWSTLIVNVICGAATGECTGSHGKRRSHGNRRSSCDCFVDGRELSDCSSILSISATTLLPPFCSRFPLPRSALPNLPSRSSSCAGQFVPPPCCLLSVLSRFPLLQPSTLHSRSSSCAGQFEPPPCCLLSALASLFHGLHPYSAHLQSA